MYNYFTRKTNKKAVILYNESKRKSSGNRVPFFEIEHEAVLFVRALLFPLDPV